MPFDRRARGAVIAAFALTIACRGANAAFEAAKDVGGYHVVFAADPLIIGEGNAATLTLTRAGRPIEGALVTLRLSMPNMSMPASIVTLHSEGSGRYRAPVRFAMSGHWLARVAARTPDSVDVRTQFDFTTRDR